LTPKLWSKTENLRCGYVNVSQVQGSDEDFGFIEDEQVIEKILRHLALWEVKARPPPKTVAPPLNTYSAH